MENNNSSKEILKDFDAVMLKLASPDRIKEWSYGEVTKPETINYRTQRSERGGLFDERIFGPEKDYECYCGKYKKIRYKGITCEKCGVEITRSVVRRERMGHIELASPVAHIWFLRGVPSRVGLLLGLSVSDLEKVIYFAGYIITEVFENEKAQVIRDIESEYKSKVKTLQDEKSQERLKELLAEAKREVQSIEKGRVIDEVTYHKFSMKYSTVFEAGIGAEAIHDIFKKINIVELVKQLEKQFETVGAADRPKLLKRLSLARSMVRSNIRPEWMFLTVIPVTPPALRPMVTLDGGRHATSDVNDLYRRVINRNNRLKKLKDIGAPDVILRNEKRILQESVDALIDNSIRHGQSVAMSQSQKRSLKSLSDVLKGKQGLFRQNLLGKRVDYSGRSVIVVGPNLHLDQCGLPKNMALELFRPFVISKILAREMAFNIRGAGKLIDEKVPEVWAILEEVTKGKYVLLNRAPTLHRLGIQAFKPVLIEGSAIQVHPLVCSAFNADFDGDQMAVHVPLSDKAQKEARELMSSAKNLLKPGNGEPVASAKMLDIVLGSYWTTKIIEGEEGEGQIFGTPNAAIMGYDFGKTSLRAKIKVLGTDSPKYAVFEGKPFETSVGRLLFNSILPSDFTFINKEIDRKIMSKIVDDVIAKYGMDGAPAILDKIKNFGFKWITRSGITWGIDDVNVPKEKEELIARYQDMSDMVREQFNDGLLSEQERYGKTVEVWQRALNEIEKLMPKAFEKNGSVYDMIHSGARGSMSAIVQMAGMKGLIINTAGRTLDFPIVSSNKEGLSPLEYFISTHGSRKGLVDIALNTAKAGYLTRRLVDVAQSAIITEEDCGETHGKRIVPMRNETGLEIPLSKKVRGRVLSKDVVDPDGKVLFKKGHIVTKTEAQELDKLGVEEAWVRTPLMCKAQRGICQKCYGLDLGRDILVQKGEAVGIMAAQAIGESGTQLTMRTFHAGGIAAVGGDITMGLPRVEEIFERRLPKSPALVSKTDGEVIEIQITDKEKKIIVLPDTGPSKVKKEKQIEYSASIKRMPLVRVGEKVVRGQLLTDGSADISEIFKYAGKDAAEDYIINETLKIYDLQGASISPKHAEVIVRQMFSRTRVREVGDSNFTIGNVVENAVFEEETRRIESENGLLPKGDSVVMGISEVSLSTESWLSAASFQHTTRILIDAAVQGRVDSLRGLKENVIIGRLIPAGTGYQKEEADDVEEEEELIKDIKL